MDTARFLAPPPFPHPLSSVVWGGLSNSQKKDVFSTKKPQKMLRISFTSTLSMKSLRYPNKKN